MTKNVPSIFIVFFGLHLLLFVASCCWQGGCCRGGTVHYFDVTNTSAQNVERIEGAELTPGSTLPDQSVVTFDQFLIFLELEIEVFSSIQNEPQNHLGFSFINTAYACSPLPIGIQPTEEVDQILVFSNADFTTSTDIRPAGDTLNDLFIIGGFLENPQIFNLEVYNEESEDKETQVEYFIGLENPVLSPQTHQFTVHYYLTNGEFYAATTESVEITP